MLTLLALNQKKLKEICIIMNKKFIFKKNSIINRPTHHSVEEHAIFISHQRIKFISICIIFAFIALIARLFDVSLSNKDEISFSSNDLHLYKGNFTVQRGNIEDRNHTVLAINLGTASLYGHPSKVIDPLDSAKKLCSVLENVKCADIEKKLMPGKTFVWIKRHLGPLEQQHINDLGIVGVSFMKDERRVYPHGRLFAHAIGYVDIDGNGISGIEKYFDDNLKDAKKIQLSLDVRAQQILRDEILSQAAQHNAIGGSGVILDVNTGEIIAMVSLPDFDPNLPSSCNDESRFNQVTLGAYEMGSTFKALTMAMGIEGKNVNIINDIFDTDAVVKIGSKKIQNFRGKGGIMSAPEVLMYSSNIGSAQIALKVGAQEQKRYLSEFGMLQKIDIELPEKASPIYPQSKLWSQASTITISYGHGIAVTPLHVVTAMAAMVNGGYIVKPTLLKVHDQSQIKKHVVLSSKTSDIMRKLLRIVAIEGYAKKANVPGYFVGGKTGTAEKVVGHGYSKNANLASFVGAFPMDKPKYAIVVLIDEAMPNSENMGFTTGGMIAAPVAGRIIEKVAPILGVVPRDEDDIEINQSLFLQYQKRNPMSLKKN